MFAVDEFNDFNNSSEKYREKKENNHERECNI